MASDSHSHSHGHGEGHSHSHGHGHSHGHSHAHGGASDHKHGESAFEQPSFVSGYGKMVRQTQVGYEDLFHLAAAAVGMSDATNVLVVGCGGGQELVAFSSIPSKGKGKRSIVGVDPSGPFLAFAKQRVETEVPKGAEFVKYVQGYAYDLPEPGTGVEPFDAATSMFVLHHCPDDDTALGKANHLRDIAKRMKPGGKLFLVDANRTTDDALFRRQIEAGMAYQIIRGVSPEMTDRMVKGISSLPLVSEARTLELLAAAGFTDVLRLYSAFHVTGWVGTLAPKKGI